MIKKLFLNEKFILILILLNAIIIFISEYNIAKIHNTLIIIDNVITVLFIIELVIKFKTFGIKEYFHSNWNRMDFILIVLSIPTLITFIFNLNFSDLSFLLIFRVMRVFKSFRVFEFIPGIESIFKGISRALKSSVFVIFGFSIYLFIISIFSSSLFSNVCPKHFGNPGITIYSIFKIFTVEGWYEIPEQIVKNLSPSASFFTYLYFIFIVLSGGIFGLSIVNSIFVDAMVSDNNDEVKQKIDDLNIKIDTLIKNQEKEDNNS